MKFHLKPILSEIKHLYSQPVSIDRFKQYISKLQGGTKGDLALPIGGFNPMAKEHILQKISELVDLEAERIIEEIIKEFNANLDSSHPEEITVVLNIADDLKGGWTNFFSTDFDSKFKINALVNRNFCAPYVWTSESYTRELIKRRTLEYLNRTFYRIKKPQPKTLEEHLEQEVFSATSENGSYQDYNEASFKKIESYYEENRQSEEYDRIFNFFYGDKGSESLGYKKYGMEKPLGYEYAQQISKIRRVAA